MLDARSAGMRKGAVWALSDASLLVDRGETVVVLGGNGAGKTTLLRLLAGLERPTRGEVRVRGRDPARDAEGRRGVGIVLHEHGTWDELTVEENLRFTAGFHLPPADLDRRAEEALRALRLEDRASDLAGSLSRGGRQRLALARALAVGTDALLLDEPFAGLDPGGAEALQAALAGARGAGAAILLASNDPAHAEIGTRTVRLEAGQIVEGAR